MVNQNVRLQKTSCASLQHSNDTRAVYCMFLATSAGHDILVLSWIVHKLIKDSLAEIAMYGNLLLLIAPAIRVFALLAELLSATPTSKIKFKSFKDNFFQPKHIVSFVVLAIIKFIIIIERMCEWSHHDVLTQRGAGHAARVSLLCCSEDVLFSAGAHFSRSRPRFSFFYFFRWLQRGPRFLDVRRKIETRYCWKS
uniref:Uncharacterized protein n=1 Tax=Rhipicephalus microplus TaxID=6941 RepID=A0A6G5AGX7_RHIMP